MAISSLPFDQMQSAPGRGPVIACVGGPRRALEIALTAAHFAQSFGRPLVLYHVIEASGDPSELPDPFTWSVRRQEARRELERLRGRLPGKPGDVTIELNEGDLVNALVERTWEADSLLVIGAPGVHEPRNETGRVARLVSLVPPSSLLLVPPGYVPSASGSSSFGGKARIVVPIDGSNFAEAALAEATRLACRTKAEICLVHIVPDGGLTDFGPPGTSDLELQMRLERRNELAASAFLETTLRRLINLGISARSLCLKGDPRTSLLRSLCQEAPDLVILSAKGQGGKRCSDLSIGGTASYLLDHLTCPVMVVRPSVASTARYVPLAPVLRMSSSAYAA